MSEFVDRYRAIWGDDPRSLLAKFDYQPELTARLDALQADTFGIEVLHEIVLWKLNRYPRVTARLLEDLRSVAAIAPTRHRDAADLLGGLLWSPGIALPMASTILRFLNPRAFQIIDDRAFRVLYPGSRVYPAKPPGGSKRYVTTCSGLYFEYLDRLHAVTSEKLPFEDADRILYLLDIELGHKIGQRSPD
jgi:hypothetical protein